jgi:hypothetical protein
MAFVWIGGPQLGIDAWSAGIALLALGAMSWSILMIREGEGARAARAGVVALLSLERRERIADLLPLFHSGEVRRVDWYFLARRWDVCHLMWKQHGCRMPGVPLEPEGTVRENIYALAKEIR